jgi:hypothetical protein
LFKDIYQNLTRYQNQGACAGAFRSAEYNTHLFKVMLGGTYLQFGEMGINRLVFIFIYPNKQFSNKHAYNNMQLNLPYM